MVKFLTGDPFSSRKRTAKVHMPGPLMIAARMTFLPFLRVKGCDATLSTTMSRSPESTNASSPFNQNMPPELTPAAIRTFGISSGELITVTSEKMVPYGGLFMAQVKLYRLKMTVLLSSACHCRRWSPTFTFLPFFGTTLKSVEKLLSASAVLMYVSVRILFL